MLLAKLTMRIFLFTVSGLLVVFFILISQPLFAEQTVLQKENHFAEIIKNMKSTQKGPFERIRWFCNDGTVLPPEPFACKNNGGGHQHGEWSSQTKLIHDSGYLIANFYADLDFETLSKRPDFDYLFAQMIIEKFLISADAGWILRQAQYYRGAFQEEEEREGAHKFLTHLLQDNKWIKRNFLQIRIATSLIRHGIETTSSQQIRQISSSLAQKDNDFISLRNRIHVLPTADDVEMVRDYAMQKSSAELKKEYNELIRLMEAFYASQSNIPLNKITSYLEKNNQKTKLILLQDTIIKLEGTESPRQQFHFTAQLLMLLRELLPEVTSAPMRLHIIDTSLIIEAKLIAISTELNKFINNFNRHERLKLLSDTVTSLYGTGLLNYRQKNALETVITDITRTNPNLDDYRKELNYLALTVHWANQNIHFLFAPAIAKLTEIEPMTQLFQQDQVRSSPLFFFAQVIDGLIQDSNIHAGITNKIFDKTTGSGLRALNPGIANGTLLDTQGDNKGYKRDGIYILPETVADLSPVAGIITAGEGNPLSHVQLLARNLSIPNVAIDTSLLDYLKLYLGKTVTLAVSAGGSVSLQLNKENETTMQERQPQHVIRPEMEKLDLKQTSLLDLSNLRATDSGKVVGPKTANLGELKHHFPEAVADGIAIPFGVFRKILNRSSPEQDKTLFEWMQSKYRYLEQLPVERKETETEKFRQQLEQWILNVKLDEPFKQQLQTTLINKFGQDGSFGVFVRSDTNVEDLPGFTGAGLNLTVPNVVGIENIFQAIIRVWASPFSARAFAWRQALMETPEHVYPAVLLLQSVNVEKSGVMVTENIESGDMNWISIAINEGVGGAVDGQSAESLRINRNTKDIRLMAQARSPTRRQLSSQGGIEELPASGNDAVLSTEDINMLIKFVTNLPETYLKLIDDQGQMTAADIEFGLLNGKLKLFQIRPFLRGKKAEQNEFLRSLDPSTEKLRMTIVDIDQTPIPNR